jgi:2-polyprenyl-3-methyl-5-hydroxy-6-metoxy-1,4-benzoquinol methylase
MLDQSTIHKTEIGYFHSQRPEMLKYIPENAIHILDVGCSEGTFCNMISRPDRELWGVEINPDAAQVATKVCYRVLVGDFNAIFDQLPNNYFDCVIFNDVLEHLLLPWETIQMVKSLLSPDGVLVSSIPNFRYIDNLITEILFHGEFQYKPEGGILDDTHIRFFTTKSIRRMFIEQGYEVLVHDGIRPCKSWKEKLFINLTFGFLKDSRYRQFATVAKPVHT